LRRRMDRQAHPHRDHHRDKEADHEVAPCEGAEWKRRRQESDRQPSHSRASNNIHPPMAKNPIPATILRILGETTVGSCPPTSTASRLDRTSAPAEAQNTPTRLI